MAAATKPRRTHRPQPAALSTLKLAKHRARTVPTTAIAVAMSSIVSSFKALREGVATESQWHILAGSVELSLAIERQGTVLGLAGHLTAAEAALVGIKRRAMERGTWRPVQPHWQEIEDVETFVALHTHQLEVLGAEERQRALQQAEAIVRSAGGQVADVHELQGEQGHLFTWDKDAHHL